MTGIRVGGATQSAYTRAAYPRAGFPRAIWSLASTTSAGVEKLQNWLAGAIRIAEPVFWQHLPNILIALLTPAAGVALVLGLWRVSADVGWTDEFLISGGFFSHWQVWIALSIALKLLSSSLLAWAGKIGKIPAEE